MSSGRKIAVCCSRLLSAEEQERTNASLRWFAKKIFCLKASIENSLNALRLNGTEFSTKCEDKKFFLHANHQTLRLWYVPAPRLCLCRKWRVKRLHKGERKVTALAFEPALTFKTSAGPCSSRYRRKTSSRQGKCHKRSV